MSLREAVGKVSWFGWLPAWRSVGRAHSEPDAPKAWHERYRLLVQLAGLVVVAAVVAAITFVAIDNKEPGPADTRGAQARAEVGPILDVARVAPADLPSDWGTVSTGLGVQAVLRDLELGALTRLAERPTGNVAGYASLDPSRSDPRQLSAGVLVGLGPGQAEEAFAVLAGLSLEETAGTLQQGLTYVSGAELPVSGAKRLARVVRVEGASVPRPLEITIYWALSERSLVFVALNDFFNAVPVAPPVDMAGWLEALVVETEQAEAALAVGGVDGSTDGG